MKHLKLALLISAVTVFGIACAGTNRNVQTRNSNNANVAATTPAPTTPAPDELALARATYNVACLRCHKENGEGGAVALVEGETLKVPSFKSGHGLKHTDAEFARQIAKGGDGMPAFEKRLTPEQINDLVRLIRRDYQAGLTTQGASSPAH